MSLPNLGMMGHIRFKSCLVYWILHDTCQQSVIISKVCDLDQILTKKYQLQNKQETILRIMPLSQSFEAKDLVFFNFWFKCKKKLFSKNILVYLTPFSTNINLPSASSDRQPPNSIYHARHSPQDEETYIFTKFILNVLTNCPYGKLGRENIFSQHLRDG